jgi:hypothetical protein
MLFFLTSNNYANIFLNRELQYSITKKKNENYVNIFFVYNYFSDILNCFIYTYASLCVHGLA